MVASAAPRRKSTVVLASTPAEAHRRKSSRRDEGAESLAIRHALRVVALLAASLGACDISLSATASAGRSCKSSDQCGAAEVCAPSCTSDMSWVCQTPPPNRPCTSSSDCPAGQTCAPSCTSETGEACQLPGPDAGASSDATVDANAAPDAAEGDASPIGDADATVAQGNDGAANADAIDEGDATDAADQEAGPPFACNLQASPSTLVLFGGTNGRGDDIADTWIWDGGSWTAAPARDGGPGPRDQAVMAAVCGFAVLAGGVNNNATANTATLDNDVWLWNGNAWQQGPPLPQVRYEAVAGTLGSTLYVFGGVAGGFIPETDPSILLAWNGGLWSPGPQWSDAGPGRRSNAALAATDGGLLLFGGDGFGVALADTWLLTDSSWTLLDDGGTDGGPPGLFGATMAAWGDSVILFGGQDDTNTTYGDTWMWNGSSWSKVVSADAEAGPPARYAAVMGNLNGQVLLFGGLDSNLLTLGDTWLWDGGWTQAADSGPPARSGAAISAF